MCEIEIVLLNSWLKLGPRSLLSWLPWGRDNTADVNTKKDASPECTDPRDEDGESVLMRFEIVRARTVPESLSNGTNQTQRSLVRKLGQSTRNAKDENCR